LDVELVARRLALSRERAQGAIASGQVTVAGALATKANRMVAASEPIVVSGPPPRFVSRGGVKLDAALDRFSLDVSGLRALDAGASTGGFTDCLLQRGVSQVLALDVGRGQLHDRLRRDERVTCVERTNLRLVSLADLGGEPFEVLVADLSFISLRTVAPVLLGELATPGADVVALVKPQFETGNRAALNRGRGVLRDRALWLGALEGVIEAFLRCGAAMMGVMVSPITGADGNVEFLLHCRAHAGAGRVLDTAAALDCAHVLAPKGIQTW
jgi:23S rRNA (cytidine1920-2'-O)/16S rRNA (cytidine1409-2'-O)-methyltransferase